MKPVNMQHLKCCERKLLWVQIPPRAQIKNKTPAALPLGFLHKNYLLKLLR